MKSNPQYSFLRIFMLIIIKGSHHPLKKGQFFVRQSQVCHNMVQVPMYSAGIHDLDLILCSASLVREILHVSPDLIVEVEIGTSIRLNVSLNEKDSNDDEIAFIDANHCPGSVIVLLRGGFGTYLHTGRFGTPHLIPTLLFLKGIFDYILNSLKMIF